MKNIQLEKAFSRRQEGLLKLRESGTNCYRLFSKGYDGEVPVSFDVFGDVIILNYYEGEYSASVEEFRPWAKLALELTQSQSVYLKSALKDRSQERANNPMYDLKPWMGVASQESVEVSENGVKYLIRPYDGYQVGLFMDQRENRRTLARAAKGKRVLNLFAYTGAFSVACAMAGAEAVTSVDVSKKVLKWADANFALNGLEKFPHQRRPDDAVSFLKRAARRSERYGLIIIDPPSFSRSDSGVFSVEKDWKTLLKSAVAVLEPGGTLFFSSNFRGWEQEDAVDIMYQWAESMSFDAEDGSVPFDFNLGEPGYPLLSVFLRKS